MLEINPIMFEIRPTFDLFDFDINPNLGENIPQQDFNDLAFNADFNQRLQELEGHVRGDFNLEGLDLDEQEAILAGFRMELAALEREGNHNR